MIAVQIVNIILKSFAKYLVDQVGYDTHSHSLTASMEIIFIASFINIAIIPVMTTANFRYAWPINWIPIQEEFSDFDDSWYA